MANAWSISCDFLDAPNKRCLDKMIGFIVTFILIGICTFLIELVYRRADNASGKRRDNKSFDASGGSVFLILIHLEMLD